MAVAFDAVTTEIVSDTTFNHACGGTDRSLAILLAWKESSTAAVPTSVKFDGTDLTLISFILRDVSKASAIYLPTVEPPTGSKIVLLDWGGDPPTSSFCLAAVSFTGAKADQSASNDNTLASASSTSPDVDVTTVSGDMVVCALHMWLDLGQVPVSDNDERFVVDTSDSLGVAAGETVAAVGTTTNTGFSWGNGRALTMCAAQIQQAAAGGPTVPDQTNPATSQMMGSGGMVGGVIMKRRDRIYVPERLNA